MGERIDFIAREQQRLDVLLAEAMEATRSRAAALIREGRVEVEGVRREKAGFEVKPGWRVCGEIPQAAPARAVAQDLPVRILYQDRELAVVY